MITNANEDVRKAIFDSGVRFWRVAEALNISDISFSKKLRKELSPKEKAQIIMIIEDLKVKMKTTE